MNDWWAMIRPGKKARIGTQIILHDANGQPTKIIATVLAANSECHRRLKFSGTSDLRDELNLIGEMPLPPYIHRNKKLAEDKNRYQTVFAKTDGSVAAPTAGLHFTPELLEQKQFEIGEETVRTVNEAKKSGNRVIAVGTTTVRVLESVAAQSAGKLNVYAGKTNIFIFPPFDFKIVDALLTNFHLPCSTLLMLVSAFASPNEIRGREMVLSAYAEAIRERYRFFSYGDAMLIL
jgi:S-adenosylmethionine:tRNA ribosyltransferase-isomerase